ncbi:MAG: BTAD domain-containing putative transcriptional regulator [bacterium]
MKRKRSPVHKITRPSIAEAVPRQRLFCLLDQERKAPVIWVTSPAGSGKTTLIASYIAERKVPCVWYKVDPGDADIASFFYYMRIAVRMASPRRKGDLPLFTPEYLPGVSIFTRRFFEGIYSRLEGPWIMVFDDYQCVPEQSAFHEVIHTGLRMMEDDVTAILMSREDTPPSLVSLQAHNAMQVLDWNDLRFSLEESRAVVERYVKAEIPHETAEHAHKVTQGWIAGLILMAQRMNLEARNHDTHGISTPTEIFDYFAGEVFKGIDTRTQDFLLETAFLPAMTPRNAENLSGVSNAGHILSVLNRKNCFTERLYHPHLMYRYHPLFRDFLLARARGRFSQDAVLSLQHRAAEILENEGQVEDAIEMYCMSGEWERLSRLILRQAPFLVSAGRHRTLEGWLKWLPGEILRSSPWLLFWLGVCRVPYDVHEGRKCLEDAHALFGDEGDSAGLFLCTSYLIDTFLIERGNIVSIEKWSKEMERLTALYPAFPSREIDAHVTLSMTSALIFYQPMHPSLPAWEERADLLIRSDTDLTQRMVMGSWLILHHLRSAEYAKAGVIIDLLRPLGRASEHSPMASILWWGCRACYLWLTGRCEECQESVETGLDIANKSGVHIFDCAILEFGAYSALSAGDYPRARSYLERTAAVLNKNMLYDVSQYHFLMAWEALLRGRLAPATEHAEKAVTTADWIGEPFIRAISYSGLAQVLLERGSRQKASEHIEESLRISREIHCYPNEFKCLLVKAYCAFTNGDEGEGIEYLRAGMSMGREKELGMMDFLHPPIMAEVCSRALEHGIEKEYVQWLIRTLRLKPRDPAHTCEHWPWPVKIFTLDGFSILIQGKVVDFHSKVQKRPIEMLKVLVASGEREVGEMQVSDMLWPDADGDMAHRSFATTLHRLRCLLGDEKTIRLRDGKVGLVPCSCWVDAAAFEHILAQADDATKQGNKATAVDLLERAVALYRGPFLPEDAVKAWSVSYRERLRYKFIRAVAKLGCLHEEEGALDRAIECFERGLDVDDLAEGLYHHLMLCLARLGRKSEAIGVYGRCKKTLSAVLGIEPSRKTDDIYRSLFSK